MVKKFGNFIFPIDGKEISTINKIHIYMVQNVAQSGKFCSLLDNILNMLTLICQDGGQLTPPLSQCCMAQMYPTFRSHAYSLSRCFLFVKTGMKYVV